MYLKIEQRLPGLNEVINANRRNKYLGAKLKRETEEIIGQYIINNLVKYLFNVFPRIVYYDPGFL